MASVLNICLILFMSNICLNHSLHLCCFCVVLEISFFFFFVSFFQLSFWALLHKNGIRLKVFRPMCLLFCDWSQMYRIVLLLLTVIRWHDGTACCTAALVAPGFWQNSPVQHVWSCSLSVCPGFLQAFQFPHTSQNPCQ